MEIPTAGLDSWRAFGLLVVCAVSPYLGGAWAGSMRFTNVTEAAGIEHRHTPPPIRIEGAREDPDPSWITCGAAAEDFDGDGWIDLFAIRNGDQPTLLYHNNGDGTFTDVAAEKGVALITRAAVGAAAADFDNDGDVDLCVTRDTGPHYLLINQGGQNPFVVDETTLAYPTLLATSPSFGDVDNDGFLELAVGNWHNSFTAQMDLYLYRNSGGSLLEPYDFRLFEQEENLVFVYSPRFADLNGDGLADLPIVCDFNHSRLFLNRGEGLFVDTTFASRVGTDENGMGSAIGDYDNDGDLDWFVSSIYLQDEFFPPIAQRTGNRLYRNLGEGVFDDVTTEAGVRDGNWGWGSAFGDLDNDGDLDLFHVNGWSRTEYGSTVLGSFNNQPARLYENLGDGTFLDAAEASGAGDRGQGRGTILFDYDNDGDLDIYIANNQDIRIQGNSVERSPGTPALLRNDSDNANHWIKVELEGKPPLHRHGIGSRVYLANNQGTQMRELQASTGFLAQGPDRIAHFGLGPAAEVLEMRAEWVNGDKTLLFNPVIDQLATIPSPAATLSNRSVFVAEPLQVSGADAEPLGTSREWIIEGNILPDPTVYSFSSPGLKELRLNIFGADGTTLARSEILTVEVKEVIAADFNQDGDLNFLDLAILLMSWGIPTGAVN